MKKTHGWLLAAAVALAAIGFVLGWLDNGPRVGRTALIFERAMIPSANNTGILS